MLQSLHVKNLALIDETEVEFGEGLNILTGETGAGKSVLIGSVNLALGGKFDLGMLRSGAEYALVELVFSVRDEKVSQKLSHWNIPEEEDGTVIISRKVYPAKSVQKQEGEPTAAHKASSVRSTCRINGESVAARQIKELAEVLIDIHGQHEHQSLLHKKKHMEILDAYCGEDFKEPAERTASLYRQVQELKRALSEETLDEAARKREQSLAEFEYQEIVNAGLKSGEDEEFESRYRKMINGKKITESLTEMYQYTGTDGEAGAGNGISRGLKCLRSVSMYDEALAGLEEQLSELDSLLADFNRDASAYMQDLEFDGEDFQMVEDRLNEINRLKGKYGKTIEEILSYAQEKQQVLEKLADYDVYMQKLREELSEKERQLLLSCAELSRLRKKNALELTGKLKDALVHLNFASVEFLVAVRPEQTVTALGYDDVEFMISTNPGEALKPLAQVASGGELSRVMLAIKTVLARRDSIDTLIFDEIDTGISGKTAWKVSGQLDTAASAHQVICITHLPQIAAMADAHFLIQKSSTRAHTETKIHRLSEEESLAELARLLGSDGLSEAALSNAREMRSQALQIKECRQ